MDHQLHKLITEYFQGGNASDKNSPELKRTLEVIRDFYLENIKKQV